MFDDMNHGDRLRKKKGWVEMIVRESGTEVAQMDETGEPVSGR